MDINNNSSKSSRTNISDDDIYDYLNIDTQKWMSEKPISILHLDAADRAVLKIAGKCLFVLRHSSVSIE